MGKWQFAALLLLFCFLYLFRWRGIGGVDIVIPVSAVTAGSARIMCPNLARMKRPYQIRPDLDLRKI
jgi:Flp pilus assembly protein protease CpaA